MKRAEITINEEKFYLDFNQKKLFNKYEERVKNELSYLKLYVIQEGIDEPKNSTNHSYIGAIKKQLRGLPSNDKVKSLYTYNIRDKNETSDHEKNPEVNYFLIPCSKSKINLEQMPNRQFELNDLSFDHILRKERNELLDIITSKAYTHTRYNNKKKCYELILNDIDFDKSERAFKVYSKGKILNSAKSFNWSIEEGDSVFILSALFGIINANDFIPLYDFAIRDRIGNENNFALNFWKKSKKLDLVLKELNDKGLKLYNLLSEDYNLAVNYHENLVIPHVNWVDRGDQKGKWVLDKLKGKTNEK